MSGKPLLIKAIAAAATVLLLCGCSTEMSIQSSPSQEDTEVSAPVSDAPVVYELDLSGLNAPDLSVLSANPQLKLLDLHGLGLTDLSPVKNCSQLEWLDIRGNEISCEEYDELAAALPGCCIIWDIPLGSSYYDSSLNELVLPDISGNELNKLHYFTALSYVDATAVADQGAVAAISLTLPDCHFKRCVTLCGVTYPADTPVLDLSSIEGGGAEQLAPLTWFSSLEQVDLRGWVLTIDEMNAAADSCPGTEFLFSFSLAGTATDSSATQLDISGQTVADTNDILPYLRFMPYLTYLDMCNCGLSNQQMEELCSAYPGIKFAWIVQMKKWSLRTDTVAFSTKNASDSAVKLSTEDIQVLRYCTDLVALDLGHQLIDDITVIGELSELRALVLVDNLFSDLSPLEKLTKLEFVELYANPNITDITPLIHHPSLKEINISKCPGISDFSPFLEMDGIEMLYMNDTICDGTMLEALRSAHPEAIIHCESWYSNGNGWRGSERYKAMADMFDHNYIHDMFLDK